MIKVELKVCGMKHNTAEVAGLQPDYLGFIFFEGSPRNFNGVIPKLPDGIKKVGVFVDAPLLEIQRIVENHSLDVVQLHGEETPEFCEQLQQSSNTKNSSLRAVEVWKVFSIKDSFDFSVLTNYERFVDKYLFDTKGKEKGGNGYVFDWNVLKKYPSNKPFVLSGGIGLEEIEALKEILKTELPIAAIDVNSRFETKPGMKDVMKLKRFIEKL